MQKESTKFTQINIWSWMVKSKNQTCGIEGMELQTEDFSMYSIFEMPFSTKLIGVCINFEKNHKNWNSRLKKGLII